MQIITTINHSETLSFELPVCAFGNDNGKYDYVKCEVNPETVKLKLISVEESENIFLCEITARNITILDCHVKKYKWQI